MIADTGAGLYGCKHPSTYSAGPRTTSIDQVKDIITVGEFYDLTARAARSSSPDSGPGPSPRRHRGGLCGPTRPAVQNGGSVRVASDKC